MKQAVIKFLVLIAVFTAGIFFYHLWNIHHQDDLSTHEQKILYWAAPMDPNYRSDTPGKSPMGMDLVPVYAEPVSQEKNIVTISPAIENSLGVEVATVKPRDLARIVNTVGYITVDENNIEHIHTYTDGWIKEQAVKTTGEQIRKGQLLMTLYSPSLNNAQEELLVALRTNNKSLIEAGKKKLSTLGMAPSQVDQIISTRRLIDKIKIFASQDGIVSKLNVREGQYVKPDTELLSIEDLSQIWIIAEVFEYQAAWVENNQPALATLPYLPGKIWQGLVDYVYPRLDPKTHTLRIRLTFPNLDLTLKPNMYANVKIISNTIKDTLAIPKQALIRTGEEDRVILSLGKGRFKAQPVQTGIESGNYYQILSGLKKGDKVVTSAQFLIDSESNIKAATGRLKGSSTHKSSSSEAMKTEHIGMGVVQAIDIQNKTITINHQPISSLDMEAMTMTMPVSNNISLESIKSGNHIHFIMVKQKNKYKVTKIHIMDTTPLKKKGKK